MPGRVKRLSLAPVCWLSSFTGSFALPTNFSFSSVLNVAFQPLDPSPAKCLDDVIAISEAVAAEGTISFNGTVDANEAILDDSTETDDDVVTADEVVTARVVFVIVSVL